MELGAGGSVSLVEYETFDMRVVMFVNWQNVRELIWQSAFVDERDRQNFSPAGMFRYKSLVGCTVVHPCCGTQMRKVKGADRPAMRKDCGALSRCGNTQSLGRGGRGALEHPLLDLFDLG